MLVQWGTQKKTQLELFYVEFVSVWVSFGVLRFLHNPKTCHIGEFDTLN